MTPLSPKTDTKDSKRRKTEILSLLDKRESPKGEGVRMNTQANFQTPPASKTKFLNDLASSALLWKAKAFVVANIAYYAMSSSRGGM